MNRTVRPLLTALLCALALAGMAQAQEAEVLPGWSRPAADGPLAEATPPSPPAGPRTVRDRASELVLAALQFIDVPYRRGGAGHDGFDCSGFTRHIFDVALGLVLPRRADDQARAPQLREVSRHDLQPGDLVFFNTLQRTFSHVGIYLGEGRFIHAPRTGSAVRIESMGSSYWARRYTGARRAAGGDGGAVAPAAALPSLPNP